MTDDTQTEATPPTDPDFYKKLEPVDPEGPGAGPESDYEVVADYPTDPFPEETAANA